MIEGLGIVVKGIHEYIHIQWDYAVSIASYGNLNCTTYKYIVTFQDGSDCLLFAHLLSVIMPAQSPSGF